MPNEEKKLKQETERKLAILSHLNGAALAMQSVGREVQKGAWETASQVLDVALGDLEIAGGLVLCGKMADTGLQGMTSGQITLLRRLTQGGIDQDDVLAAFFRSRPVVCRRRREREATASGRHAGQAHSSDRQRRGTQRIGRGEPYGRL